MQAIFKQTLPGVLMITITGALYGALISQQMAFVALAGAGAFVGALAGVGLFGHPGREGWLLAALGAVVATALGAGVAGGIVHFPDGVVIAPLAVAMFPADQVLAAPLWIGLMGVTHLLMRHLRQPPGA